MDLAARPRTNAKPKPAEHKPAGASVPAHTHAHPAAAATSLHQRTTPSHAKPKGAIDLSTASTELTKTSRPRQEPAADHAATHERHLAHLNDRLSKAKQVERSPLVDKFPRARLSTNSPAVHATDARAAEAPKPAAIMDPLHRTGSLSAQATPAPTSATIELPADVATRHQAMANLPRLAPAPNPAPPTAPTGHKNPWRPHLDLAHNRAATIGCVVAVMAAYIWVQNYPKLALHNAINKAGVAGSLPGYVPSSYRLAGTDSGNGLITLNFRSPSSTDPLKITQHTTTWDSSSLLDNYVAQKTDDYATVQGQGLTIYLFNNNQAAWVNHGVWYGIEGAGRLSREQILKIAYSL